MGNWYFASDRKNPCSVVTKSDDLDIAVARRGKTDPFEQPFVRKLGQSNQSDCAASQCKPDQETIENDTGLPVSSQDTEAADFDITCICRVRSVRGHVRKYRLCQVRPFATDGPKASNHFAGDVQAAIDGVVGIELVPFTAPDGRQRPAKLPHEERVT